MNMVRKVIWLVALIGLNWPIYASQSERVDGNACRTTSKDWRDLDILFPGASLGEAIVQLNQNQGAISAILGGGAGTLIGQATDIQLRVAVNALPTIQLPLPVNYQVYPYVPLNISSDLSQAISQVNPTPLITLGAAVNTEVILIGVPFLPPTVPLPIPYPYLSSGILHTDLVKAIGQVDTTGGVSLGQAVTNTVNKVGIASTHASALPPLYVMPANRTSSGIINTDLNTFNTLLSGAPLANVGATYQALIDRFALHFRNGGPLNVIGADTPLPNTLDGIMTALGI